MQSGEISASLAEFAFVGPVKVRDLWNHKDIGTVTGIVTQSINSHGAGLCRA